MSNRVFTGRYFNFMVEPFNGVAGFIEFFRTVLKGSIFQTYLGFVKTVRVDILFGPSKVNRGVKF